MCVSLGISGSDGPARILASVASADGIEVSGASREIELGKKLYVGNIPFTTTEDELRSLFEQHGSVESINVITDRETGRPRGFAFVEMDASAADAAMQALDGKDMGGRSLRVNEANERGAGGGGGGGGRGRY